MMMMKRFAKSRTHPNIVKLYYDVLPQCFSFLKDRWGGEGGGSWVTEV